MRVAGACRGGGGRRQRRRCAARSCGPERADLACVRSPPGAASRGVARAREREPEPLLAASAAEPAAAMATTVTCTRFTDEYQLYEDIGK